MAVDLLRQGQTHAHEKRGPVDRVETHDLLADDVDAGPEFLQIVVFLVAVAQGGDIVEQGVQPDVDDVLRVEVDRDAPGEAGAAHTEVLQAAFAVDEAVDHLIDAGSRLEKIGLGQKLAHLRRVLRGPEEVSFLFSPLDLAPAVGALAVDKLGLGPEALAGGAVPAVVFSLVDVAVVVHFPENALDALHMILVGGADVAVVADVHQLPQRLDAVLALDDVVHELLRSDAGFLRLLLDLHAVLVGSGEKHHVIALQPLVAGDGVRCDGAVGVPNVHVSRGIVDRGGDIESLLLHTFSSSFHIFPPFWRVGKSFLLMVPHRRRALSVLGFRRVPASP